MTEATTVCIVKAIAQVPAKSPKSELIQLILSKVTSPMFKANSYTKNRMYIKTDITPIEVNLMRNLRFFMNVSARIGKKQNNERY